MNNVQDAVAAIENLANLAFFFGDSVSIGIQDHGAPGIVGMGQGYRGPAADPGTFLSIAPSAKPDLDQFIASILDLEFATQSTATVSFYGCNVADVPDGTKLLEEIAKRTGAIVIGYSGINVMSSAGAVYSVKGTGIRETFILDENGHGFEFLQDGVTPNHPPLQL